MVFYRIHPINWPIAFLLSFVVAVAFRKSEMVPLLLLRRFYYLDPEELMSSSEWMDVERDAHDYWQEAMGTANHQGGLVFLLEKYDIDFTVDWLQELALNLTGHFHLVALAAKWKENAGILTTFPKILHQETGLSIPLLKVSPLSFLCVDWLWNWLKTVLLMLRRVQLALKPRRHFVGDPESIEIIWTGISSKEIPTKKGDIDIGFLSTLGHMHSSKILYVLPEIPSPYFQALRRNWIHELDPLALNTLMERMKFITVATGKVFLYLFSIGQSKYSFGVQRFLAGLPFYFLAQKTKPKVLVTSVSAFFPAAPYVAFFRALGCYSVTWFYSSNDFLTFPKETRSQLKSPIWSICATEDVVTWNRLQANRLGQRQLANAPRPKFNHIIGPIMCGDEGLVELCRSELVERLEPEQKIVLNPEDFLVGVYDLPLPNRATRMKSQHGPLILPENHPELFFQDIARLAISHPNWKFLLKLKVSLLHQGKDFPEALRKIVSEFGPQMIILDHKVDPYLAIGLSDVNIGMPFTSPVFAGLAAGKPSVFYDPGDYARFVEPRILKPLVLQGFDQLERHLVEFEENRENAWTKLATEIRLNEWSPSLKGVTKRFVQAISPEDGAHL